MRGVFFWLMRSSHARQFLLHHLGRTHPFAAPFQISFSRMLQNDFDSRKVHAIGASVDGIQFPLQVRVR